MKPRLVLLTAATLLFLGAIGAMERGEAAGPSSERESTPVDAMGGGGLRNCSNGLGTGNVQVPDRGAANPYPVTVTVGLTASPIADLNIDVNLMTHTEPDDMDILVVAPNGRAVMVMSDAGGDAPGNPPFFFTLDDEARGTIPDAGPIPNGHSVRPVNYTEPTEGADFMPAPAPPGPYFDRLSAFDGLNPNGTWQIYVSDDQSLDSGGLSFGLFFDIQCAVCFGFESQMVGTAGPDNIEIIDGLRIHTLGGDDVVTDFSGGTAEICGGTGNDTIDGSSGATFVDGGAGNDILRGGGGRDDLRGNSGRDILRGEGAGDSMDGGPDVEIVCAGGSGSDTARNCDGNTTGVP
jgi:hypothetical protein